MIDREIESSWIQNLTPDGRLTFFTFIYCKNCPKICKKLSQFTTFKMPLSLSIVVCHENTNTYNSLKHLFPMSRDIILLSLFYTITSELVLNLAIVTLIVGWPEVVLW